MNVSASLPWLSAALLTWIAHPAPELRVQGNAQNIVSQLIEGTWVSDEPLNTRLGARDNPSRLEIARDDSLAAKLPAKYEEFLGKKILFAAGTMTWKFGAGEVVRGPILVIEQAGNPHLVMFRPRGDEPLGDAESCNVMLVRGKDRANDLLFMGGDTATETFRAFRREVVQTK